jgi:protein tyrosine phosphatase (PTP) superfamily phosphohydrolase (DUF442 family)
MGHRKARVSNRGQPDTVARHRRSALVGVLCILLVPGAVAQQIAAPNVVPINPMLVTSGQPGEQALRALGEQGFQAVIYLAPSSVPDAIRSEPALLARQGIEFVHIPIPFGAPTEAHFDAVSAAIQRLQGRKALVHCQVNLRASTMVFLHRVIRNRDDPALAWEAVSRVWSPEGAWKKLVTNLLTRHEIKFDPF